ncbi:hypothetical protein [Amycolatopsis thermoflava]|uniref:hypothetical protein n=1 Tax=Amycolatopsis thermoflava TaxID=84480 RepID=UPI00364F0883
MSDLPKRTAGDSLSRRGDAVEERREVMMSLLECDIVCMLGTGRPFEPGRTGLPTDPVAISAALDSLRRKLNASPGISDKVLFVDGIYARARNNRSGAPFPPTPHPQQVIDRIFSRGAAKVYADLAAKAWETPLPPSPPVAHRFVTLPEEVLQASNPAEFADLLRRIMEAAGMKASQIANRTAIPRSQAYKLVDTRRTSLPTMPEQVGQFLQACRLDQHQTHQVMNIWGVLRDRQDPAPTPPLGQLIKAAAAELPAAPSRDRRAAAEGWVDRTPREIARQLLRRRSSPPRSWLDAPLRELPARLKPSPRMAVLLMTMVTIGLLVVPMITRLVWLH